MHENELARNVVETAYQIHVRLGPGSLESAYKAIMIHELRKRGLEVAYESVIQVVWDNIRLELGFRADIIVNGKRVLELKSIGAVARGHKKQLLTYLRLTNCRLGLLINFGAELIKDGISRVVNGLTDELFALLRLCVRYS